MIETKYVFWQSNFAPYNKSTTTTKALVANIYKSYNKLDCPCFSVMPIYDAFATLFSVAGC